MFSNVRYCLRNPVNVGFYFGVKHVLNIYQNSFNLKQTMSRFNCKRFIFIYLLTLFVLLCNVCVFGNEGPELSGKRVFG